MRMDLQTVQELSALIRERGIDVLVLTTREASLRLERDAADGTISRPVPAPRKPAGEQTASADAPAKAAPGYELTAPSPGIFLDRHPLGSQPLVRAGLTVRAGQLIGFLRVGCLLLPLRSAQAGRITSLLPRPGDILGYGSVVVHLATEGRI
jgi:acetyl-CoA carboxylase biotin carboxyl carrier protein